MNITLLFIITAVNIVLEENGTMLLNLIVDIRKTGDDELNELDTFLLVFHKHSLTSLSRENVTEELKTDSIVIWYDLAICISEILNCCVPNNCDSD